MIFFLNYDIVLIFLFRSYELVLLLSYDIVFKRFLLNRGYRRSLLVD